MRVCSQPDLSCRQACSPCSARAVQVYTIYSILFIVFIILIIVTAFITIALTYFQLAVEDHRWWWRSFMCGGSTGASPRPCCQSSQLAVWCVAQCSPAGSSLQDEWVERKLGKCASWQPAESMLH